MSIGERERDNDLAGATADDTVEQADKVHEEGEESDLSDGEGGFTEFAAALSS